MKLIQLLLFLMSLLLGQVSYAAGFQFYELGTPVIGTAAVGQAALASDASTAYFNPAGMAFLPATEFMIGTQVMLLYINFTPGLTNTIRGNNGANAGGLIPGVDFYFVYNATPNLKFGVSLTAPYGGSLNYEDHWVGRFYAQQLLLYTLNLNPVVAYQINPWAAVGGGLAIEYANLWQTNALQITPLIDGQITIKTDNTALGFNLGVLLMPMCGTKLGIAYRSQIIHNLRGKLSFFNLNIAPNVSSRLVSPAGVIASITQEINAQFRLLGEVGWSSWSSMKNIVVDVNRFSASLPQHWHDTYRVGIASQYTCGPLLVQGGVSYDSSPTSSSRRTPNLPMDRQIRVGAGIEYAIAHPIRLGLSYEYLNLGRGSIHNVSNRTGVLAGSYSRNYVNIVQLSLNASC